MISRMFALADNASGRCHLPNHPSSAAATLLSAGPVLASP